MRVIYNKVVPFGRFRAINLCGVLFSKVPCDDSILRHEAIHTAQMRELAYIGFYLWYVIEWLVRLIQCRHYYRAYQHIAFEREAYAHQHDPTYLPSRHHYAFLQHI